MLKVNIEGYNPQAGDPIPHGFDSQWYWWSASYLTTAAELRVEDAKLVEMPGPNAFYAYRAMLNSAVRVSLFSLPARLEALPLPLTRSTQPACHQLPLVLSACIQLKRKAECG